MREMMGGSDDWLSRRLDAESIHQIYEWEEGSTPSNSTTQLISSLLFDQSKQVRTSTLILAAFNILTASWTAASILYDCYWASKYCSSDYKAKYDR
jgi:hypothetical protein